MYCGSDGGGGWKAAAGAGCQPHSWGWCCDWLLIGNPPPCEYCSNAGGCCCWGAYCGGGAAAARDGCCSIYIGGPGGGGGEALSYPGRRGFIPRRWMRLLLLKNGPHIVSCLSGVRVVGSSLTSFVTTAVVGAGSTVRHYCRPAIIGLLQPCLAGNADSTWMRKYHGSIFVIVRIPGTIIITMSCVLARNGVAGSVKEHELCTPMESP